MAMSATLWLLAAMAADPVLLDRPAVSYLYGSKYRDALKSPLSATWENAEPRSLLRRLAADQQVALLLDRRLDPSAPITFAFAGEPFEIGLDRLAAELSGGISLCDNVVYLGPVETARWLRTLIQQHDLALHDDAAVSERRRFDLSARHTIAWQDLDTPHDVLHQIATRHKVSIPNADVVPHDLWGAATLPQVTAAEALTLVLIQFDLDWEWTAGAQSVRIVPYREPPLLERRYQPRGRQTAAQLHADWIAAHPDWPLRVEKNAVIAVGRVEDHEELQARLTTGSAPRPPTTSEPTPLRRRQITLRVENAPIAAVMRELEKSGVTFVYDAAKFQAANVDLERLVSLDLKQATADEFLKQLFAPLPIEFEIDNRTVALTLKP